MLNWDKISLKKLVQLTQIKQDDSAAIVGILFDCDARELNVDDFILKLNEATELLTSKLSAGKIKHKIKVDDKEFKFNPNCTTITAGQFIDFTEAQQTHDVITQVGIIYGGKSQDDYSLVADNLTVPEYLAALSFFAKASEVLLKRTKLCSQLSQSELTTLTEAAKVGYLIG